MLLWLTLLFGLLSTPAWAGYSNPVACPAEPARTGDVTAPSGSCANTTANVPAGATIKDAIHQQFAVSTAELDQSNTATLAVIGPSGTTLSITLAAGKTYICFGHLTTSGSATAGVKVGLVATSSLTVTSMTRRFNLYAGTTLSASSTATALDATSGGGGATAAVTDIDITAVLVVNAGGVLNLEGAQNVATTGSTNQAKFLINSYFGCLRTT